MRTILEATVDEEFNRKKAGFFGASQRIAAHHFRMTWSGDKYPEGATIDGIAVSSAQNGIITGVGGELLGFYEREIEFGGESHMEQRILIATKNSDVTPPPGGSVVACSARGRGGR